MNDESHALLNSSLYTLTSVLRIHRTTKRAGGTTTRACGSRSQDCGGEASLLLLTFAFRFLPSALLFDMEPVEEAVRDRSDDDARDRDEDETAEEAYMIAATY